MADGEGETVPKGLGHFELPHGPGEKESFLLALEGEW